MKSLSTLIATLACALSATAALNVQAATATNAPAATPPVAGAASAATPGGHASARLMQQRGAKFAACRKEALDQGLRDEALKTSLLACMN